MKYNFIKTTLFSTLCAVTLMSSATTAMAGKNATFTSTTKNTGKITIIIEEEIRYGYKQFGNDRDQRSCRCY